MHNKLYKKNLVCVYPQTYPLLRENMFICSFYFNIFTRFCLLHEWTYFQKCPDMALDLENPRAWGSWNKNKFLICSLQWHYSSPYFWETFNPFYKLIVSPLIFHTVICRKIKNYLFLSFLKYQRQKTLPPYYTKLIKNIEHFVIFAA